MDFFVDILREYPALAVFLTLGLGFLLGKIRFGNFSLGSVTSVLLVGVVVGQMEIPMSGPAKTIFFMLFLFSIGYSVGPEFFKSIRGSGGRQALFAVIMSTMCFGSAFLMAWLFGYNKGETIGLFSGSQTCSSLLGVGAEAMGRLGLSPQDLKAQTDIMPVCYAVTYIFGTLGTVILLGNFGPKLLGGVDKVKELAREYEKNLTSVGISGNDPASIKAMRVVDYRAYRAESPFLNQPRTVGELEHYLRGFGIPVYVDRIRHNGEISAPGYDTTIYPDDEIVVCGHDHYIVEVGHHLGEEISDSSLLDYPLDRVGVVVAKKSFTSTPFMRLRKNKFMHGVVIRDASRDGEPMEINAETEFKIGDRLTIIGRHALVEKAAAHIGHIDRPSVSSDLMFLGLAIFIGGFFGALSIWIGSVPLSFGTSGGALIAGLLFGWLRSKRPTFGNISPGAIWLMNNLGLNAFIAIVGIEAAPSFVAGIRQVGPMLFVAGAVATLIPLLIGLWMGHKIFRFNPAITLGCCAGTRTCTAALGAVQNALGSTVPAIAYTVTYTVANILLVIWGLLTVNLI